MELLLYPIAKPLIMLGEFFFGKEYNLPDIDHKDPWGAIEIVEEMITERTERLVRNKDFEKTIDEIERLKRDLKYLRNDKELEYYRN